MEVKDQVVVASDRVKDLKEKVDALVRSLVGSIRREDNKLVNGERGLEHRLTSDGWDEDSKTHKDSALSRKEVLDSFDDVVSKLDEVTSKSHELFGTFDTHLVVPTNISVNPADIPTATLSLLTPQVQGLEEALTSAAAQRPSDQYPPVRDHSQLEGVASDISALVDPSLNIIRESLKSVRGGAGLKKQARRMFDPGWHDYEAERAILAAAIAESALRVMTACQGAGLRASDFRDKDHEKVFETMEKMKSANQIKSATFPVLPTLRKELGENRKVLLTKLEAHGKKFAPCDLAPMISSVLLKARLRRMNDATAKGVGLKQDASQQQAAAAASAAAGGTMQRPQPAQHPADPPQANPAAAAGARPGPPQGAPGMRPGMGVPGRGQPPPGGMAAHAQQMGAMNMPAGMGNAPQGQGYAPNMRR